jgi:cysteinyl-tRNA synthetase
MNITDVEDKTIKGSIKEKISLKKYTKKFENAFFEDLEQLNMDKTDTFPRATDNIKEMVNIIDDLLKKKIAYKAKDGIYFDISKFNDYGKLSKTKLENLQASKRILKDQYEKDEAQDFALWKFWDKQDYDVFWETKIGKGRPGWHIECSAMSMRYLGKHFDIHAGGVDLIFPHHENEIAQSEASSGKKFANYWLHNEHLLVDGKKMSKSLGNFYTLRDLLEKGSSAKAIRYLLLSVHYRQQLNFTKEAVEATDNAVQRLDTFVKKIKIFKKTSTKGKQDPEIKKSIEKTKKDFIEKMDDDLNISEALAVVFDFVKAVNTKMSSDGIDKRDAAEVYDFMKEIDSVLGVIDFKEEGKLSADLKKLIDQREKARKEKDFDKADKIRADLEKKGILLEDTSEGVRWKKS